MMRVNTIAAASALFSAGVSALRPEVGKKIPHVAVENRGEVRLLNNVIEYDQWSTDELKEKIRFVQHMAGTTSAKRINERLADRVTVARAEGKLPDRYYQSTTIINVDDSLWGTKGFVRHSIENIKQEIPYASFVIDEAGHVKKRWDLQAQSSAVVAINEESKVIYFKEGKLSDDEIDHLLNTLFREIQRLSADE